jgi:5-methylcytosine-specific restriction enzyme A
MSIDVENIEILDSYEITKIGIFSIVKKGLKGVDAIGVYKRYTDEDIDDEVFPEGKELTELHKRKERNPRAVRKKKRKVLKEYGKLECEVCGFDFVKFYGQLGYGFAERHHTVLVSKLSEEHNTKLSDLAIVCANCHRMLHRARPLISISELIDIIKKKTYE